MSERKPRKAPADEEYFNLEEPADKPSGGSQPKARTDPAEKPGLADATPVRPTVNLDQRQLTRKQQEVLAAWRGENAGRTLDAYMRAQVEAARAKFGHSSVMAANEASNLIVGIPCPSLAFEYLIAQDCMPLGLIFHQVGLPGSLKSATAYEYMRWFRAAGGGSHLLENETKFSPDLLQSIVGFADDEVSVIVDRTSSLEEWQTRLQYWIETQKRNLIGTKEQPGPGRTIPLLFVVDAITSKASFETQEKVRDQGYASRGFAVEALSLTTFMKCLPQHIDGWPFTIVFVNHVKPSRDDMGRETRNIPGGKQVCFQESFEIENQVVKSRISCADPENGWEGVVVRMRCYKNSFGPTHRSIETRMLWWEVADERYPDPADPRHWRQKTVWDWDWALVKLLVGLQGREKQRLESLGFHIKALKTSDVENRAWSATLGQKEKDAMPWSELGRLIQQDAKICDMLRSALGIKRRPLMAGDYLEQLQKLSERLP